MTFDHSRCASRLIGVNIPSLSQTDDAFIMCPECGQYWLQFPIGDPRRSQAFNMMPEVIAMFRDGSMTLPKIPIGNVN